MSIWCDGNDLNTFKGDSGEIFFTGLPPTEEVTPYFSVRSIQNSTIIFELSSKITSYWGDAEGMEIPMLPGETTEEYEARMQEWSQESPSRAIRCGKTSFFIPSEYTDKLTLLNHEEKREFYWGLKLCNKATMFEDTIVPLVTMDEETGEYVYREPPRFIVRQKFVEGTCEDLED